MEETRQQLELKACRYLTLYCCLTQQMAGFSTETTRSLFNALNAGRIALFVSQDRLGKDIYLNFRLADSGKCIVGNSCPINYTESGN